MVRKHVLPPLLALLLILGCSHRSAGEENDDAIKPSVSDKAVVQAALSGSGGSVFVEPSPAQWEEYIKVVREYFHLRTKAVLHKDMEILWNRYPDLKKGTDSKKGINVEKNDVQNTRDFNLIDANVQEESHEKIKVREIKENQAIVRAHGSLIYVKDDFDVAGGELLIHLHLERRDGRWTVVKSDEYTLPEYKEWIKNSKQ